EILVVDDYSPDGTGQQAEALAQKEPRLHVLHRGAKLGLGTAYITGFKWALERGFDYVFEMDADFSHDPVHLKEFLKAIAGADLVRRPNRGAKQDEPVDRAGSRVDGAAAETHDLVRPHLVGTAIYKMTGSGNDFVMVDARHTTPEQWAAADIRAVCARGTGVGADGRVFVGPGTRPDSVRMIYFNPDGPRAAVCADATLCSTRLATRLGLGRP